MGDTKKILVITRDRQAEALRVAGGLTLSDDTVEVFILDRKLDKTDPAIAQPLELVTDLDLKVSSNVPENGYPVVSVDELAKKILDYDIVVPY